MQSGGYGGFDGGGGGVDDDGGVVEERRENEKVKLLWCCIIRGRVTNEVIIKVAMHGIDKQACMGPSHFIILCRTMPLL